MVPGGWEGRRKGAQRTFMAALTMPTTEKAHQHWKVLMVSDEEEYAEEQKKRAQHKSQHLGDELCPDDEVVGVAVMLYVAGFSCDVDMDVYDAPPPFMPKPAGNFLCFRRHSVAAGIFTLSMDSRMRSSSPSQRENVTQPRCHRTRQPACLGFRMVKS